MMHTTNGGDPLTDLVNALDRFLGGPWLDDTDWIAQAKEARARSLEAQKASNRSSAAKRKKDRENRGGRIKRTFDAIPGYRAIPDAALPHGIKYRRTLSLKAAEERRQARKPCKVIRHGKDDVEGPEPFMDGVSREDHAAAFQHMLNDPEFHQLIASGAAHRLT
jgi:hypothetical protein